MTVIEIVKKYGLEDFAKDYNNQYGNFCNLIPLKDLMKLEVKAININFPTNHVTITVIEEAK